MYNNEWFIENVGCIHIYIIYRVIHICIFSTILLKIYIFLLYFLLISNMNVEPITNV